MPGSGGMGTYGVVNMTAKRIGLAAVAVKKGRVNRFGQGTGDEHGVTCQRYRHNLSGLLGSGVLFRQLQVVFNCSALATRCDAAVGPISSKYQLANLCEFIWLKGLTDANQHGVNSKK